MSKNDKVGFWKPIYELVQAPFSTVKYRKRTAWECSICGKRETENIRKQECVCGATMKW